MNKTVIIILMTLTCLYVDAQDIKLFKQVVKELSSAKYQGRGYAKDGANKAGKFLKKEFEKVGVSEVAIQPSNWISIRFAVR